MRLLGLVLCLFYSGLAVAQSEKETVIFLVRHAEKSLESSDNPSLSENGKQQALKLAQVLKSVGIEVVYSTDTKRTKETAQPLSEKLGVPIELYSPKDKDFAAGLIQKQAGKKILVVGHSNTLPDFLNFYTQSRQYQPAEVYGELFVIIINPQKPVTILKLHYD